MTLIFSGHNHNEKLTIWKSLAPTHEQDGQIKCYEKNKNLKLLIFLKEKKKCPFLHILKKCPCGSKSNILFHCDTILI